MSETKNEKQSGGSITTPQASNSSKKNLKHGSEPANILLAMLYSLLATLIEQNKAVLATANYQGQPATIIVLVGTQPTDQGIELVGSANRPLKVPTSE